MKNLNPPSLAQIRQEAAENLHGIPESLLKFAATLSPYMKLALESEEASEVFGFVGSGLPIPGSSGISESNSRARSVRRLWDFIKYGSNPGTIVIGIDGMRSRAQSTGKMKGAKTGILRANNGACLGAWAEIYRSDWDHPARAEVSLREYATDHRPWQRMPETMIKKVAEMHALRMAFPNELGGLYGQEEMDQAKPVMSVTPVKVEKLVAPAKEESK